ncbi:MAG: ribonuclease HII [Maribacter sp.]
MNTRLIIGLFFLLVIGCSQQQKKASSLLDFIPQNAAIIVKINNLNGFKSDLKNNDFLSKLESFGVYKAIFNEIKHLDHVKSETESILAFSELGANNFEFTYVTSNTAHTFVMDSVQNIKKESVLVEGQEIDTYDLDGDILYSLSLNGKKTISSSRVILENQIKYFDQIKTSNELEKLYEIASATKNASIFINLEKSEFLSKSLLKENSALKVSHFSDWILVDVNVNQNHINLIGISVAKDSVQNYLSLFKGTNPLENTTPTLAPSSADAILSYTFDDYSTFALNQQQYLHLDAPKDSLLNTVEEIGFIYRNGDKTVLLNTYGSEKLSEYLGNIKKSETEYQGNQVLELNKPDFLNLYLNPLIADYKANFCTIIENAFIFAENRKALEAIINSSKNGSTFEKTDVFASAKDALADESSILFVSNATGIEQMLDSDFSQELIADFRKATFNKNTFAAQVVADKGFFHTNVVIQQTGRKSKINTISPLFTLLLDADLATDPQFVTNHRTNKKEIVVQDQENNLYLISTQGKVLWKKQLEGQVQGKIHQVDIYKNKRLQLAFTTNNQFLILDRNGKEVNPFTKKFEGGNLNGLAVFDYENKKDYRFVVTQGNKVFMYNNKGSIVGGFKYTQAESPILKAPKHMVIANKDYLVFTLENGDLKILNRVGNIRTSVSGKIDFSQNEVYLYKNKFVLTDKKGVLHQIAANGKSNTTNLRLNQDHGIDATSKTFVYMNDNVLSIRGKRIELDFGVYTPPKIFYIYDKIYVGVTDIQNQKVYLFDSQAIPISNFPVFGSSLIDLTDMENDRKLEVVTQDQKNSIIVYQMN